jgi:NAD(P)H-flavin reductase/hemoglobin-like flavoprotein
VVDAARLKDNWRTVAGHGDQVPLHFYSSLFLGHPDIRQMFPVSMANQRDKLVRALGRVISGVDDLDSVVPVLAQLGRDHRKFGVAPEHYPAVGRALLETLEHFSGADWTPALARDWAAAFGIVADVMIAAAEAAAAETPAWWDLTVDAVDRRTVDVAVLDVTPHTSLPYRAGQSVAVETPMRPRLWRYYTPATVPAPGGSFELHVRLVPGGPVSTAIVQGTQVGDVFRVGAPVGEKLTLDPGSHRDLLLLAGGTGLAPMKALVQQVEAEGSPRRVHLFWGVRYRRELYDLAGMRRLADGLDRVHLVPCVSQEPPGASGVESGSVVDVALGHGPWHDHEVYVCGSPGMVQGTVGMLRRAGVPSQRLHVEEIGSEEAEL